MKDKEAMDSKVHQKYQTNKSQQQQTNNWTSMTGKQTNKQVAIDRKVHQNHPQ